MCAGYEGAGHMKMIVSSGKDNVEFCLHGSAVRTQAQRFPSHLSCAL